MGPHCGPGFREFPPHHLLSHRLRGEGGASAPKGGGPAGPVGTERVQRVQRVQRGRIAAFGGNNYKVSVTGLAFVSLWRPRHFERRYKPVWFHSFMEPVKGSPQISLQNAALRQSVQHRVSFLRLPSYTLSRCAGLPLKGKQGLAAELAMCCLSPAKHSAELATSGGFSPFGALRHHLSPRESVSLGSQVAITPLRTKFACHPAVRGKSRGAGKGERFSHALCTFYRECASQSKLAHSLPIKGPSF